MTNYLRQSTATSTLFGPILEATDGYSYRPTTISIAGNVIQLRRANDALGVVTTLPVAAVSLPVPGWLGLNIPASDTGVLGPMRYMLGNVTSNLPVWMDFTVLPANVYDSYILGTDFLQVDVMQITGDAPSSAAIGSVANLTTGVGVTSVAAGVGVNVSSIAAGVGVNASSIAGVAPSTAMGAFPLDYVIFTPGVQSITLRDTWKMVAAVLGGKVSGATGASIEFYGVSGEKRVSALIDGSGNRTAVTWVTG